MIIKNYWQLIISFLFILLLQTNVLGEKNNQNFDIITNNDKGFELFSKKTAVFNIPIYATYEVDNIKLLHAANILAQYLDNNEDGMVDNIKVLNAMLAENAALVMWKNNYDLDNFIFPDNAIIQDLGDDETNPLWHTNKSKEHFDAAIEEVLHLITNAGFANAYPDIFGTESGTKLTKAMDIARGGKFIKIPFKYPSKAWYTYYDNTCNYNCMSSEYFYWAMTSILNAQDIRLDEIEEEWHLNTKKLVQKKDIAIYKLLTDKKYKLPSVLPDITYKIKK